VPRPLDADRRADLLEQVLRYAAEHGIAALTLRQVAPALGTSARMLVHYFDTKEHLIEQLLAATRPDVPALLAQHGAAGHGPRRIAQLLWHDLSAGGDQEPRVRLLLEVMALGLTQPDRYGEYATTAVLAWVEPLADALRAAGHPAGDAAARATLLVSGLRGLALDRYLTGDRARTDAAADHLIAAAVQRDPTGS
jgi:AcrR family transcriptional regulator